MRKENFSGFFGQPAIAPSGAPEPVLMPVSSDQMFRQLKIELGQIKIRLDKLEAQPQGADLVVMQDQISAFSARIDAQFREAKQLKDQRYETLKAEVNGLQAQLTNQMALTLKTQDQKISELKYSLNEQKQKSQKQQEQLDQILSFLKLKESSPVLTEETPLRSKVSGFLPLELIYNYDAKPKPLAVGMLKSPVSLAALSPQMFASGGKNGIEILKITQQLGQKDAEHLSSLKDSSNTSCLEAMESDKLVSGRGWSGKKITLFDINRGEKIRGMDCASVYTLKRLSTTEIAWGQDSDHSYSYWQPGPKTVLRGSSQYQNLGHSYWRNS